MVSFHRRRRSRRSAFSVATRKTWKLDSGDEQAAEVERLVGLGGVVVEWDYSGEDPDFIVLADPEGNRFCVVNADHPVG